MPYLLRPHELNRSKVDTSKLRRSLEALEQSYKHAQTARAELDEEWGPHTSAPKRADVERLNRRLSREVAQQKQNIQQAFTEALEHAERGKAEAYRTFTQSPVAVDYRATLAAYAPMMPVMSQDVIAAKLRQAIAAGCTGEVRGLVELSGLYVKYPNAGLLHQLQAVKDAGLNLTPLEVAAEQDASAITAAKAQYDLVSYFAERRVEDVVAGVEDFRSDWYSPDNIFNGLQQEAQSSPLAVVQVAATSDEGSDNGEDA